MDDRLTASARADDTHFSFENKRDSLRSIPSGPEKLPGRKALLNRLLEERVPSWRSEAFKKLVLCGGLSQTFAAVETGSVGKDSRVAKFLLRKTPIYRGSMGRCIATSGTATSPANWTVRRSTTMKPSAA